MKTRRLILASTWVLFVCAASALAQGLRFSNRRDVGIPDYATLRIGPFYSDMTFSQSAGFRYVRTTGAGTDFLFENDRGAIQDDGAELPLVSSLSLRNYLIVGPSADLDISMSASYEHYPMETQEDAFSFDLAEEGISGTLSSEFRLSPFLRGSIQDAMFYQTDYVDLRGVTDEFGGQKYTYFNNVLSLTADWLVARDGNLGLDLSREDNLPTEDGFEEQERVTYNETLGYEHEVLEGLFVGASAGFNQVSYAEGDREDAGTADYALTTRFDNERGFGLTRNTSLDLSVGFDTGVARSSEGEETDEQAASVRAALTTQLRKDMSHTLSYDRGLRVGYDAPLETYDTAAYDLTWRGVVSSVRFGSAWTRTMPGDELVNGYSDWNSSLGGDWRVARAVKVDASLGYSIRLNDEGADEPGEMEPELVEDYGTWTGQIGTSVAVARNLDFVAYYQRAMRDSDSDDLAYTRDMVSASFTYNHHF